MKINVLIGSLLMMVVGTTTLTAQYMRTNPETGQKEVLEYYLGAYGALNINYHQAEFGALPGIPSCCADYNNVTGLGPAFGLLFETHLAESWRLQLRGGYSTLSGPLSATETIGNEPVLDDGPVPVESRRDLLVDHSLEAGIPLIVIEPAIGMKALDLLWLYAGLRGGMLLNATFDQKETLTSPDGYVFKETGTAVRNQASGNIPDAASFNIHLAFGLGYELNVSRNWSLVPEVRYFLPLMNVTSAVDWSVQSFQMGASIRYGSYSPIDPTIIRDTVYKRDTMIVRSPSATSERITLKDREETYDGHREGDYEYQTVTIAEHYIKEMPVPFDPRVRIAAYTKLPDGTRVRVDTITLRELDIVESYPLLPYVFFPENSADLQAASVYKLDPSQTATFTPTGLRRDQIEVYRHLLNIVGQRMTAKPSAKITITGCVSNVGAEQKAIEVSKQRAAAVKQYLVDVWKIDPKRINTTARLLPENPGNNDRADGRVENQRAEITSNDLDILFPVEFRDRDRTVTPSVVEYEPVVENGDGITDWTIGVKQGSTKLFDVAEPGKPHIVEYQAGGEKRPTTQQPVVTEVIVANDAGQSKKTSMQIPVNLVTLQEAKATTEGGKQIERYSLIVFDYNSAKLNETNQRIMDLVKSRIKPDSKVLIRGFADRTGESEYNRDLAMRRCAEAKRVLGVPDEQVTLESIGSDRLIYDNEIAEGRSYCRTVQIEIETPVR